ncbi:metallopeptidase-like protein 6 [Elsinoe australis]|uniref:Metallopeptidase-like protein 6 n=1 Tax=Elsinoe australis TaxID=40998 RepID=A0A4U7APC2_9PEZI|nr:metallopeptidase-like protein 6 [Elsinoe australis]
MYLWSLLSLLLAFIATAEAQGINFRKVLSKKPALFLATNTRTATSRPAVTAASITSVLMKAKPTAASKPRKTSSKAKVRVIETGNCSKQIIPFGYAPAPNTPIGFLVDTRLAASAKAASSYPAGYTTSFTNQYGSIQGGTSLNSLQLSNYNVSACAAACSKNSACNAFNIYFTRSPTLDIGTNCPNPTALADVRCTLWSSAVSQSQATNIGNWRSDFMVVVQGSNGYSKVSAPGVSGFQSPVALAGAVDSSNTFVGADFFITNGFDPRSCATFCQSTTAANRKAAQNGRSKSYQACNYFNALDLTLNGKSQGTYCQLYTNDSSSKAKLYTASLFDTRYDLLKSFGYMAQVVDSGVLSTTTTSTIATTPAQTTTRAVTTTSLTTTTSTATSSLRMLSSTFTTMTTVKSTVPSISNSTATTLSTTTSLPTTSTTTTTTTSTTTTTTTITTATTSKTIFATATNPPDRTNAGPGTESEHFSLHGNNTEQKNYLLPYLETAYSCFVNTLNWLPSGHSNTDTYLKTNGYIIDSLGGSWMSVDGSDSVGYFSMDSAEGHFTAMHEYGHVLHYHQSTWVDQSRTGAWWETMAQFIADTSLTSSLCAPARAANAITDASSEPMHLDKLISQSYQVIVDGTAGSGNYYEAWPFLTYLTNNPDGIAGLGSDAVRQLLVQYARYSNEDPLFTLQRVLGAGASVQDVVGRYWARMAFVDIGHVGGAQTFLDSQGWLDYDNLDSLGNGTGRVKTGRRPAYMGSGMHRVVNAAGDVVVKVDSTAGVTATVAVRAVDNGAVRYVGLVNGVAKTVSVAQGEQVIVVVANTPDELILYDAFALANSPASVGIDYTVSISGGGATIG